MNIQYDRNMTRMVAFFESLGVTAQELNSMLDEAYAEGKKPVVIKIPVVSFNGINFEFDYDTSAPHVVCEGDL